MAPSAMRRLADRGTPLNRLDWVLLGSVLSLTGLGTLLVWSATAAVAAAGRA